MSDKKSDRSTQIMANMFYVHNGLIDHAIRELVNGEADKAAETMGAIKKSGRRFLKLYKKQMND